MEYPLCSTSGAFRKEHPTCPGPAVIRIPPAALTIQANGFRLSYGRLETNGLWLRQRKYPGPIAATVRLSFNDLVANSVAD